MNDITNTRQDRLISSFKVLEPRMDQLAASLADHIEHANPRLRLMLPNDTRVIATALGLYLSTISTNEAHGEAMTYELARAGAERGVTESELPLIRAALEASMAEVAGYTWTPTLSQAWASQFESLTPCAIEVLRSAQTRVA